MNAMRAIFGCDSTAVRKVVSIWEGRNFRELTLDIGEEDDEGITVSGPKLDVMCLIGEFAFQEDSCLQESWVYEC